MEIKEVLLLEDDPIIGWDLLKRLASFDSYRVTLLDSASALERELNNQQFELVITNLKLDDGWISEKHFQMIKENTCKVLIFTGLSDTSYHDVVSNSQRVHTLHKPFTTHQLHRAIKELQRA